MYEKISKIAQYVRELISKIKWSYLLLLFIILLIIIGSYYSYKIYKIYSDEEGPTSDYDLVYFEKNIDIKNDGSNETVGSFHISGVVHSKGIISPAKPAEFKIVEIDFRSVEKDFLSHYSSLCEGYICKKNVTVDVCLQGFNARGYNRYETVQFPYERRELPCIKNITLYNEGDDGSVYVSYSNNASIDLNKEVIFITSGTQSLRLDYFFGYSYNIENVFEVNPYHIYSELQLNKYVFLLTLIGFIVVIFQIIDFLLKMYDRLREQQK